MKNVCTMNFEKKDFMWRNKKLLPIKYKEIQLEAGYRIELTCKWKIST